VSRLVPPIREVKVGSGHYYVDAVNQRADGVTDVGKRGIPAPALVPWGINSVADYAVNNWADLETLPVSERIKALKGAPYAERDAASNRGREIHALADALVHGEQVDVPDELAGHVDACVDFLNDFDPQPLLTERLVYSLRYGYAGRLDAVVSVRRHLVYFGTRPDERRTTQLLDYKTGKAIYPDVAPQLAAYAAAECYLDDDGEPLRMPPVDGGLAVHLRSDGYDVYPVEIGPRVFRLWLYAQQIAQWAGTYKNPGWSSEVVGAALPRPVRAMAS
jgi:hypothetical protein